MQQKVKILIEELFHIYILTSMFVKFSPKVSGTKSDFFFNHRTYINEFETWLQQPNDELINILDDIYNSKVESQTN